MPVVWDIYDFKKVLGIVSTSTFKCECPFILYIYVPCGSDQNKIHSPLNTSPEWC
jgi:hypothetical protein